MAINNEFMGYYKGVINEQGLDTTTAIFTGLTANQLITCSSSGNLESVSNLTSYVAGTTNQISVANDGDGTITLSTPQNIATSSSPQFANITIDNGSGDSILNFNHSGIPGGYISNTSGGTTSFAGSIVKLTASSSDKLIANSYGVGIGTTPVSTTSLKVQYSSNVATICDPSYALWTTGVVRHDSLTASSLVATDASKQLTSNTSSLSPTFANLTDSGLTADTLIYSNGSKLLSSVTLGSGLSLTTGTLANSGVLSITGTTNQVTTSASTGAVTLSLPQSIATSSSPTFAGLNVTGLTAASLVATDGSKNLTSSISSLIPTFAGFLTTGDTECQGLFLTGYKSGVSGGMLLWPSTQYGKPTIQSINSSNVADALFINPDGGNVGIGTSSPSYPLDVNGIIQCRSNATIGYVASSTGGLYLTTSSVYGKPSLQGVTSSFAAENIILNPAGGNVGVGISPSNLFEISKSNSGALQTALYLRNNATDTSGNQVGISFGTSASSGTGQAQINCVRSGAGGQGDLAFLTYSGSSMAEVMRINSSGYVGIGTSPSYLLSLSSAVDSKIVMHHSGWATGKKMTLQFYDDGATESCIIQKHYDNGLTINDNNKITMKEGGTAILTLDNSRAGVATAPASSYSLRVAAVSGTNDVYIGGDTGSDAIQANGSIYTTGLFRSSLSTPASSSASGSAGEVCWDTSYIYVCTASNTWKRVALSAF